MKTAYSMFRILSIFSILFFSVSCQDTSFYEGTIEAAQGDDGGEGDGRSGAVTGSHDMGGAEDGHSTGGDDSAGDDTGGNDTSGDDTGGDDSAGDDTAGSDDGGSDDGGPIDTITDNFTVNPTQENKIDLLWVIDDSGSMKNEQEAIADNFNQFIKHFVAQDIDFRMNIVTTDTLNSPGEPDWRLDDTLTSEFHAQDPSTFFANFERAVQVGVNGHHVEKGLEAAQIFFDKYSQEFFRENSHTAIIYVSDEEDQSGDSVVSYVEHAQSFLKNKTELQMHAIVRTKDLEGSGGSLTNGGKRYIEAAERTNGLNEEINQDFFNTLNKIGENIVINIQNFVLSQTPKVDSIKVYVDSLFLHSDNWNYNSTLNSIEFKEGSRPRVGADIKVEYQKK